MTNNGKIIQHNLCLYIFYDKDGDVRDYCTYCLKSLFEVVDEILFIVNGNITDISKRKILELNHYNNNKNKTIEIFERKNDGFDFGGWKDAIINHYGFDKISKYDNLLITNNSYYGPIYPFFEMWNEMSKRKCDFWGITQGCDKKYSLSQHIHSYWIVFKNNVISSNYFNEYWTNLKTYNIFWDVITKNEALLTKYFFDRNFIYDTYIKDSNFNLLQFDINSFFKERLPIIKRKYYTFTLKKDTANDIFNLLQTLDRDRLYNIKYIYDDLEKQPINRLNIFESMSKMDFLSQNIYQKPFKQKIKIFGIPFFKIKYEYKKKSVEISIYLFNFKIIKVERRYWLGNFVDDK